MQTLTTSKEKVYILFKKNHKKKRHVLEIWQIRRRKKWNGEEIEGRGYGGGKRQILKSAFCGGGGQGQCLFGIVESMNETVCLKEKD